MTTKTGWALFNPRTRKIYSRDYQLLVFRSRTKAEVTKRWFTMTQGLSIEVIPVIIEVDKIRAVEEKLDR